MSTSLAPGTTSVVFRHTSAVFKAAVLDRRIASSPCAAVSVPKPKPARIDPATTEDIRRLIDAVPERYKALVVLAAGTGMRQGEIFGLTVDRIDFLRRRVTVDRQLSAVNGRTPTFGPPKTRASERQIPIPTVVVEALAAHLARFPPGPDGLVFTNTAGGPLRRSAFGSLWRKVTGEANLQGLNFHALRHYYASLLIRFGESVKTVQERMGHASATETLDRYSHLWPDSDDRTRDAVDSALGVEPAADPLRTALGAAERTRRSMP